MALTTIEIEEIRELLKEKNPTLFASKTDAEIDTLIGYADEQVNATCILRDRIIEYLVSFWVDTEDDGTDIEGAVTSVEIGDVTTSYGAIKKTGIYDGNLYGQLYQATVKKCATMIVGIIA